MATAATVTIAEVSRIVPVGALDPEIVVTPGIYVDRIVGSISAASAESAAEGAKR